VHLTDYSRNLCENRYLQQLVTVQASRNRDLEAQIQRLTHQQQGGSVDSSSSALTPEGATIDLGQQNFHVFGEELLDDADGVNVMGINMVGVEEILHTLTPREGEDFLSLQFSHHGGEKVGVNGNGNDSGSASGNEAEASARDVDMEDDDSGTGLSVDSPLVHDGTEEGRGRTREWSRVGEGKEDDDVNPPFSATITRGGEEKIAIKEEETSMLVV
jgi:hypothetical protein